ncbi:hypothetical protein WJX84_001924 [Apatococcus fuscideae]|uniref:Rab-GAP TBC domain-containing protein n=1 Tax=Apatococcus fuscideae TaxID=2026836 RepID=A0AAW1TJH8_9CHLO
MSGERDVYGFEVKNDPRHLSLFQDYKPLWEKEEHERSERWRKFLIGLAEDSLANGDGRADLEDLGLESLERQWQSWNASGTTDPGAIPAELQQLKSLVQAGIPLALRGRLWKLFLGTDTKKAAGVYDKLRKRALGSKASRSKKAQHTADSGPSEASPAESPASPAQKPTEREVRSRLLGTQSIGRVENSYLKALHAAEGQEDELLDLSDEQLTQHLCAQPDPAGVAQQRLPGDVGLNESASRCFTENGTSQSRLPALPLSSDGVGSQPETASQAGREQAGPEEPCMASAGSTAYACRNPAVGYCQGMNFVAGFLLLFMNEEDAFWCLAAIVEDLLPGYFSHAMVAPQVDQLVLKHLAEDHCPRLADHLLNQSVAFAFVSTQWFLCLFVNSLPPESCLRVWDMLFFESSASVLFRVALALFDIYSQALMATEDALDALSVLQNIAPLSYDSSRLLDVACIGFGSIQDADLATLRSICRLPILTHVQEAAQRDAGSDSDDESATLPASRLKVRINNHMGGVDGSDSQPSTPLQAWHATPRWPQSSTVGGSSSPAAPEPLIPARAASGSSLPAGDVEAGASTQQEGSIFAARANSEVSGGMTSSPGPAASRGTMLSRFHMPQLSFGRRGSAALPSTAVRSAGDLPLGGKVLPVNPTKSKAAAALFEIASHPSPLQRQPSALAQQPLAVTPAQSFPLVEPQEDTASSAQPCTDCAAGSPVMPRSPLKLREIDSQVAGPTQQLLAVLHGLQSELESAGLRQQAVQENVEDLEELVTGAKEQLQSERCSLADDQNTVNVLREKAVAVEEELTFVDAEVAAKQTAVTSSLSQLQLKESLLADKDTIIAQLSKQVRQAAGDGFGKIFGGLFRRTADTSSVSRRQSSDGQPDVDNT